MVGGFCVWKWDRSMLLSLTVWIGNAIFTYNKLTAIRDYIIYRSRHINSHHQNQWPDLAQHKIGPSRYVGLPNPLLTSNSIAHIVICDVMSNSPQAFVNQTTKQHRAFPNDVHCVFKTPPQPLRYYAIQMCGYDAKSDGYKWGRVSCRAALLLLRYACLYIFLDDLISAIKSDWQKQHKNK